MGTEGLEEPRQDGQAADDDADGNFDQCAKTNDADFVAHIVRFDHFEGVIHTDKRCHARTSRQKGSVTHRNSSSPTHAPRDARRRGMMALTACQSRMRLRSPISVAEGPAISKSTGSGGLR